MTKPSYSQALVRLTDLYFSYPGQPRQLFSGLNLSIGHGWCGVVGANGAGKSTLLRLIAGQLDPGSGQVDAPGAFYCAQTVEHLGTLRDDVTALWTSRAMKLRAMLGLDDADLWRWERCSQGERKRWQIGHALMMHPSILLLDEPTNHLDVQAKTMLLEVLGEMQRDGLIVSHDRHLLDALTTHTLWMEPGGEATLYPAPYSEAADLRRAGRARYQVERAALQGKVATITAQREQIARRHAAAQAQISTRRRMTSIKDHDGRSMAAKGRAIDAEQSLGQRVTTTGRALARAKSALDEMPYRASHDPSMSAIHVTSPHRIIAHLEWREALRAGDKVLLEPGVLTLRREDRIWLAGPNGAGKSTLLRALYETLPESWREHVLWMPQHLDAAARGELSDAFERCERDARSRWLQIAASLEVDVDVVLGQGVEALSPGSLRKFLLARGVMRGVWAMCLDEPTNHLDLPSIAAMESALVAYTGALCVVTHDEAFGARVTHRRLEIDPVSRRIRE